MNKGQLSVSGAIFTVLYIMVGINEGWPAWQVMAGPFLIGVILFFVALLVGER
jgi:hypothetical protein